MSLQTVRPPQPIDVREGLTAEQFYRDYVEENKPVVLKNDIPEWANRWTPELLKDRFGDRKILAEKDELYQYQKTKEYVTVRTLIDEAFQQNSLKFRVRTSTARFLNEVPELRKDLEENDFKEKYFPGCDDTLSNFWISPKDNFSVMHHDTFFENLNAMIYGRKHFIFIPPSDTKWLYPHGLNESPVNALSPDLDKYPKFANVTMYEGSIEPGDILFIPQFWWHYTTALDHSININIWTKSKSEHVRRVLATMPLSSRVSYTLLYNKRFHDWFIYKRRLFYKFYASTRRLFSKRKAAPSH